MSFSKLNVLFHLVFKSLSVDLNLMMSDEQYDDLLLQRKLAVNKNRDLESPPQVTV